jgi:hypothetical protein
VAQRAGVFAYPGTRHSRRSSESSGNRRSGKHGPSRCRPTARRSATGRRECTRGPGPVPSAAPSATARVGEMSGALEGPRRWRSRPRRRRARARSDAVSPLLTLLVRGPVSPRRSAAGRFELYAAPPTRRASATAARSRRRGASAPPRRRLRGVPLDTPRGAASSSAASSYGELSHCLFVIVNLYSHALCRLGCR